MDLFGGEGDENARKPRVGFCGAFHPPAGSSQSARPEHAAGQAGAPPGAWTDAGRRRTWS